MKILLSLLFYVLTFQTLAANKLSDRDLLLGKHQQIIDAHKHIGLDEWLNSGVDPYVSANRGVIKYPLAADRKIMFKSYINSTKFEYYRDMVAPIVMVSEDGTLGWVIVQVEAKGVRAEQNYQFQSAWVELYQKKNGQWVNVGNVSNFKAD